MARRMTGTYQDLVDLRAAREALWQIVRESPDPATLSKRDKRHYALALELRGYAKHYLDRYPDPDKEA